MTNNSPVWLQGRRPLLVVAGLSLIMVLAAMAGDAVLNRDGMYYVDMARAMLAGDGGADHEWLFFPGMLAGPAALLSVDPLFVALAYSVVASVLLAVFLFAWLARLQPGASPHLAMLVALTVPWMLEYQTYVIRDSAAWLALVVTLLLARLWVLEHRWRWLVLMPVVALCGFLFRTEMLVLLVVPGWLLWVMAWRGGWRARSAVLLAVVAAAGVASVLVGDFVRGHVNFYLDTVAKTPELMLLPEFIEFLESQVNPYARSDLSKVLVSGFLVLPLLGLVSLLGIFVLPLLFGLRRRGGLPLRLDDAASALMLAAFLFIVLAFVFVMQFLVGRYLVPLAICLMPWVYLGLQGFSSAYPRGSRVFVVVAILMAVSASFFSGDDKRYLRSAGEFIHAHRDEVGAVYYTDSRIAFYAGDRYRPKQQLPLPMANVDAVSAAQSLVLVVKKDAEALPVMLDDVKSRFGFQTVVYEVDNGDDRGVLILTR